MKELIKEARSGDPKAIQQLIQDRLSNPTLNVRVSLRKGKLQVAIVSRGHIEEERVVNAIKTVIDQIGFIPGLVSSAKVICIEELPQMDSSSTTTTGTVIQWSSEFDLAGKKDTNGIQDAVSNPRRLWILLGALGGTILLGGGIFLFTQPNPDQAAKAYMSQVQAGNSTNLLCTEHQALNRKVVSFKLESRVQANPLALAKRGVNGRISSFSAELNQLSTFVPEIAPKIRNLATRSVGYFEYGFTINYDNGEMSGPFTIVLWKTQHLRQFQIAITQLLNSVEPLRQNCKQHEKTVECQKVSQIYQNLASLSETVSLPLAWEGFGILPKPIKSSDAYCVER